MHSKQRNSPGTKEDKKDEYQEGDQIEIHELEDKPLKECGDEQVENFEFVQPSDDQNEIKILFQGKTTNVKDHELTVITVDDSDPPCINQTSGSSEPKEPVALSVESKQQCVDAAPGHLEDNVAGNQCLNSVNTASPHQKLKCEDSVDLHLYPCNECETGFLTQKMLDEHLCSLCTGKKLHCTACSFTCMPINLSCLKQHMLRTDHVQLHKCTLCETTFVTEYELFRHVRHKHDAIEPHRCDECSYTSMEMGELKMHARSHTGMHPLQCPHCRHVAQHGCGFEKHVRCHTAEEPYRCDVHHLCFDQTDTAVTDGPTFQCSVCRASFVSNIDLQIHWNSKHTGSWPRKCKICDMYFPDRYGFTVHIETHHTEGYFECRLCSFTSSTQHDMQSHMLIHENASHDCLVCGMTFTRGDDLARHVFTYHPDISAGKVIQSRQREASVEGQLTGLEDGKAGLPLQTGVQGSDTVRDLSQTLGVTGVQVMELEAVQQAMAAANLFFPGEMQKIEKYPFSLRNIRRGRPPKQDTECKVSLPKECKPHIVRGNIKKRRKVEEQSSLDGAQQNGMLYASRKTYGNRRSKICCKIEQPLKSEGT